MFVDKEQFERRITSWDQPPGFPGSALNVPTKETRVTSLSTHYGALADTIATNELKMAQDEVEVEFSKNAEKGKRTFNYYPSKLALKYKNELTVWMQNDGVIVNWNNDQRDGDWVEISY